MKKEHIYHAAMLDPHNVAELSLDDIVAMCEILLRHMVVGCQHLNKSRWCEGDIAPYLRGAGVFFVSPALAISLRFKSGMVKVRAVVVTALGKNVQRKM